VPGRSDWDHPVRLGFVRLNAAGLQAGEPQFRLAAGSEHRRTGHRATAHRNDRPRFETRRDIQTDLIDHQTPTARSQVYSSPGPDF
jgi:hypothetical protein